MASERTNTDGKLAYLLLVTALLVLASPCLAGAPRIWLEAEEHTTCNFQHFERSSMGKPHLLSGGEWIMKGASSDEIKKIVPDEGVRLTYAFEAAQTADYTLWMRIGWFTARANLRWRLDGGAWHDVPRDFPTINLMELGFFCEVSWANLGQVSLAKGKHTLEILFPKDTGEKARMLMALDCFAFLDEPFTPEGPFKPGETYRGPKDTAAAGQVYALPEAGDVPRQSVELTGLWQVARYDDPDMERKKYDPVLRLPQPDQYRLRWMGIDVPKDSVWKVHPLVFGHRLIYRTKVRVPGSHAGRGFKLHFSGTNWIVSVFVNGKLAGTHKGVWVPWDLDVSRLVRPGAENEIAVAVKGTYYAMDTAGMGGGTLNKHRNRPYSRKKWTTWVAPIYPSTKGDGDGYEYGIVCPVTLESVGKAYTEDVFVKPSVQNKQLGVELTVRNTDDRARKLDLVCEAIYDPDGSFEKRWALDPVTVPAHGVKTVTADLAWEKPKLWWPEPNPHLYRLRTTAREPGGETLDVHEQLFGFREVTVQGTGVCINGVRRNVWNWVGVSIPRKRIESPEQWLEAFRAEGNRFTRFSMNRKISAVLPTREQRLEFFDRHGVAGRLCTMIDGMFITFRLGTTMRRADGTRLFKRNETLWQNLHEHMAQVAKAYRNHPSVIMYQAENEFVYITGMNRYGGHLDLVEQWMGEVIDSGRKFDNTRPYTVGGGGDLSGRLAINSPHYPHAAFDVYPENAYALEHYAQKIRRWPWDRKKPWIVGESCFANHLAFATVAIGDEAFRGRRYERQGKARFLRMLYGGYRYTGVAGFFPWDTLPEFADGQKTFAPLAAIPRKQTHRLYAGRANKLLFKVMNDTLRASPVTLSWSYVIDGKTVASDKKTFDIEPGHGREHEIVIRAPQTDRRLDGTLALKVTQDGAPDYTDERLVPVLPRAAGLSDLGSVYVLDRKGQVARWLKRANVDFEAIDDLKRLESKTGLLVMGNDALTAAEAQSTAPLGFAVRGGAVICLEQDYPLAGAALPAAVEATTRACGYAHPEALGTPLFRDLGRDDLIDWAGDHPTAKHLYRKPSSGARPLAGAGARLQFTPLVEVPCGKGMILLCQLRVGAKLGTDPAADVLLRNALLRYSDYQPATGTAALLLAGDKLTREKIVQTGVLYEDAASLAEALDPAKYKVAVIEATDDNLKALGKLAAKARAFQEAGGWVMLVGLRPEGIEAFNRLVDADHMIRPFRCERVTLADRSSKLAATLSHRDIAMFSPNRVQHTTYWISPHVFSYVIDRRNFAPFTLPPGAPDDPMKFTFPWNHDHPDHEPYNFVNGMLNADNWRYIRQIWINDGQDHKDLVFRLRRPDVLKTVQVWNNANYGTIEHLDVILDGDPNRRFRMTLPPDYALTTLDLPQAEKVQETITLRISSWRPDPQPREGGELVGIDNVAFLRPESAAGKGVFLDTAGGLVAFPRGKGGILLNQIKFMADEPKDENEEKKLKLLGTLLQNMGLGFRSAQVVAVPGLNVRFHPVSIQEQANAYLVDREGKEGWFGHRPNLPRGLAVLPRGEHKFADVTYATVNYTTAPIPDFILVCGPRTRTPRRLSAMPEKVAGIPVGRTADVLYFLHALHLTRPISDRERARMNARRRRFELPAVARYVLHYADGETAGIPVILEKHVDHWVQAEPRPLPEARVGWAKPLDGLDGHHAVLYSMQAKNPRPDVSIQSITVERAERRGAFAVLAITAGEVVR
ncbi:MAG: glycosyl hydrolase 2 galactose-binding domain-containing protein [Planctomycetota bacterium]